MVRERQIVADPHLTRRSTTAHGRRLAKQLLTIPSRHDYGQNDTALRTDFPSSRRINGKSVSEYVVAEKLDQEIRPTFRERLGEFGRFREIGFEHSFDQAVHGVRMGGRQI